MKTLLLHKPVNNSPEAKQPHKQSGQQTSQRTPKKKKRLLLGALSSIGTFLVIGIFLLSADPFVKLITPKQETFTELYFEDHLDLPKTLLRGVPANISFSIHNLEGKDMEYPILFLVEDDSTPPNITTQSATTISVEKDHTRTFPIEIALPLDSSKRQKISIKLENLNQSIHFWTIMATPSAIPVVPTKK